jgi:murein DD-endopeptidase MepM/ murein hydrolase activator NlpD
MFQNTILKFVVGSLTAAACFISAPAFANSAASADIAAPLRAAEAARSGATPNPADDEFHQLFASWKALDTGSPAAAPTQRSGAVSIPSLVPIISNRVMSSGFGMRVHPVLGGLRAHKGIDLPATTGTPIHASADGVVGKADWFGGYGLFVELEHGAGMETRYGHMSRIAVAEGQHVRKGDVIGYVGSTGRSTGSHLHYEVRIGGEAVNPIPYMQTVAPGVATDTVLAHNDQSTGAGGR